MARTFPAFRTRSADRDKDTDARRIAGIRGSIAAALQDAQRELNGLQRRINEARLGAVALLDDSGEFGERTPVDEQAIVTFEEQTNQGERRVAALRLQIAGYEKLLAEAAAALP